MPGWTCQVGPRFYTFPDLRTLLARATPVLSGDELAGVAARSAEERLAACRVLAEVPLTHFLEEWVIPPESDAVSRVLLDHHNREAFTPVADLTVGEFREWLLRFETNESTMARLAPGLLDRKSTRLNSSHANIRMPSSA